jgi:hypothetical protein
MLTKRMGYALVAIGALGALVSVLVDYVGLGDDGIQAAQMLGILTGVFLVLAGVGIIRTEWDYKPDFIVMLRGWANRITNLPVNAWVVVTFLVMYLLLFLPYVFLNSTHQMNFLTGYIPRAGLTGLDIRAVMTYVKEWLVFNRSPYADGFIAYPPLALALFSPLLLVGYPAYYNLIIFLTLVSYLIVTLFIPLALNRSRSNSLILLLFAMGIFSYGFQFELERGQSNLIAFALCLIAIYIFHVYPKLRYFAYILFSLSIQLKIYPAIFILMFVENWRDWKSNLKRIAGIGVLNVALFFVLGFKFFSEFLTATTAQQTALTPWNGSSIRSFVFVLSQTGFGIFSEDLIAAAAQNPRGFELFFLALFGVCLVALIVLAYNRRISGLNPTLLMACTIGALIVPTISNDYKLPLLIGPMSILFSFWPEMVGTPKKLASAAVLVIVSMAFWSTLYPFKIKPEALMNNMPVLMVILLLTTLLSIMIKSPARGNSDATDQR